jgi:hypothetical protein
MKPCCAFAAAILLLSASPVTAQFVAGRVIDQQTMRGLDGVGLELRTDDGRRVGRAVTDSAGHFQMQSARIGMYTLVAERIGYRTVTAPLTVTLSEQVDIVLRMDPAALVLEPLTVEARTTRNIGPLAGYYERIQRNQRVGIGRFITRDYIDERQPFDVTDLLREVPRVNVQAGNVTFRRGAAVSACAPKVYIDGVLTNRRGPAAVDELVRPSDLEGVEVYQGAAQMPGEFFDNTGCGVIALWTRRTTDQGRPFAWSRLFAAAGAVGLLMLLSR